MDKRQVLILGMSPRIGGVESYIMNILRNINREKYEFYFPYYTNIAYRDELLVLGGKLIRMEVSRHKPFKYIDYVGKLFQKYKFDVVYYNTCDIMSMDMIMFGKKYNVPIRIIHSHNSSNILEPNWLHRCTEKWCRAHLDKYATKLLACSDVAGNWMFDGREYEKINNGIDVKKFSYSLDTRVEVRKQFFLDDKMVIGFVGSLWEQKNPLFLIDVFAKIKQKQKNAVLLVIGTGELLSSMKQRVKNLGISDEVLFLGNRNDVCRLMNGMDRFVLPSRFEGLPFVLIEAQANGLPCVTSTNVSDESNITGEVEYLSLDTDCGLWADKIISQRPKLEREKYAGIVENKGFDIMTTVSQIEKIFDGNY